MKVVRLTNAEIEALQALFQSEILTQPEGLSKPLASIAAKLDPSSDTSTEKVKGPSPGAIEAALVASSGGLVVRLDNPSGYARAGRAASQVGATADGANTIGLWMGGQQWIVNRAPWTLIGVLNNWAEWLAKARAVSGQTEPTRSPTATSKGPEGRNGSSRLR